MEKERARSLGVLVYETDRDKETKTEKYESAVQRVLAAAEKKKEKRWEVPADLPGSELFDALGVAGVHIVPRRILAQTSRPYNTKRKQEFIDAELAARGLAVDMGGKIAFIEYEEA